MMFPQCHRSESLSLNIMKLLFEFEVEGLDWGA